MNKMFSVILPIFRVEKYLPDCINSILAQTCQDFEILLIDDCSDDNSLKICREFAKKDSRIKVHRHLKNKGPGAGAARNTGLKYATGKYIMFVDPDDWLHPEALEIIKNKFKEEKTNTLMFKTLIYSEEHKNYTNKGFYPYYSDIPEGALEISFDNISNFPPHCWNKAYKTSYIKKNHIKFPEGCDFEDMEFFYKLFTLCTKTYMIDKELYIYRKRENSMVKLCQKDYRKASDIFVITEHLFKFLCKTKKFEHYKKAFLKFVGSSIDEFRYVKEIHIKLYPSIRRCLKNIKFPEMYKN